MSGSGCFVLVRLRGHEATVGTLPTVDAEPLARAVRDRGGACSLVDGAALVGRFDSNGDASAAALASAHCALELRALAPRAPILVGRASPATAEVDHPRALVIESAFRDMLSQSGDRVPILLDDELEPLVQREFETTRELGLPWLIDRASVRSRATHISGLDRPGSESLGTVRGSLAAMRREPRASSDVPQPAPGPAPPDPPDLLIGRTLGDFVLRDRLGEGGFGVVYLADQPALDRQAVVKILRRGAKTDAETVPRFLREARLASRLDHPYAAHIYAFGAEADGVMWIAMELVRGATLHELLKSQGSIGLDRFVALLGFIGEVVQTAHDQGIVHRDLKPVNIMAISRAGRLLPKLLDFGIARGVLPALEIAHDQAYPRAASVDGEVPAAAGASDPSSGARPSYPMTSDAITGAGTAVGSPPYMAPEQWRGEATSPATDQYALGVMSYELLTGQRPFRGDPERLSSLHRKAPVPALGPGFPPALDDVIRRAMAKRAEDRFPSVLEFTAAFRAAAGMTSAPGEPEVPQLSEAAREVALVHAPGPVADAVAALDAAPSSIEAHVALRAVAGAVARYLGVLALAARGRIGPGAADDDPHILGLARRLRESALEDEGWVELARWLTRPFAGRAQVHPLPELVELLWGAGGETGAAELDHLLSLAPPSAGDAATDVARAELEATLPGLERLLRACDPLWKYALAVGEGGRVQLWVGARRHRRPTRTPLTSVEEHEVVLVDADGALVASLHPIVQCLAPAPGRPPELFFLQGAGRFGARLTTLPGGLERHDEAPWSWLAQTIAGVGARGDAAGEDDDAPYLGLRPFTIADSSRFFGREREVEAALNRLQQEPLLALVGASGAGKSSFVQAGLLPSLGSRWTVITARPGARPMSQLAAQLDGHLIDASSLRDDVGNPDALGEVLRSTAQATGRRVLLVIDQFEEVLTMCRDEEERARYCKTLMRCARSPDDPVRLVITLRDDFLIRIQEQPAMRDRIGPALQLLGTPQPDDLERILVEPLARRGYQFEDQALVDTMVNAVAYQPGALALLSFTGARLWELRDRHFRHLTHKAYESLGGVGGALAQHAEELLAAMSPAEQALAREVFRHLVSAEGTRAVMSSRELADVLGDADAGPRVVQRLIQGRLLIATEGDAAQDQVEVVHEALLTQWPRLVAWQREDADGARMRDQLRTAARLWEERGRPRGALWLGDALLEYRVWRGRYSGGLTGTEEAFARASMHEEARGRRRRRVVIAIAFAVLSTGLFLLYRINLRTESQRGRAEAFSADAQRRIQMLYEEQARQSYLDGEPMRALAYVAEAYRQSPRSPTVRFLVARVSEALRGQELVVGDAAAGPSLAGAFDPKGGRFAAAQGADLHMWDLETGARRWTATGHRQAIYTVELSADGGLVATGSLDGTARVWDAVDGRAIQTLAHGPGFAQRFPQSANACPSADEPRVFFTRFTPEGRLLTGGYDGTIRLWDPRSGELLASHDFGLWVSRAAYHPGSRTVAVGSRIGHLFLWDLATDTVTLAERPHTDNIAFLEFSPDGTRLLVGSWDATATLWTVRPAKRIKTLRDHDIDVFTGGFSPDGRHFVTGSTDETAKIWDAATGEQERSLRGHGSGLMSAAYLSDGRRVVTTARDGSVRVWGADTGDTLWEFLGHRGVVISMAVDPRGTRLLTTSYDGSARVWDLTLTRWAAQLVGHKGNVRGSEVAPSSRQVATAGEDGTVRLWQPDGAPIRTIDVGTPLHSVSWSADGERLVAAGEAKAVVLDAASGRALRELAPGGTLFDASFVGASDRVVTAGEDGVVRLWDESGRPLRSFTGHEGAVLRARLDDAGARLVSVGRDTTVRVWDPATGAPRHTLRGPHDEVHGLDVLPDGARAWSSGWDADARLWDLASGKTLATISDRGNSIINLELSSDGQFLLTGGEEGFIRVWEAASGRVLASVPLWGCQSIDFSPDGEFFVFTGRNGTARTMRSGLERRSVDEIERLARCRSPYGLDKEKLVERPTDPAACAGLR